MKFTCKQKDFLTSLQNVSKAIQSNNTLPVLNNILIKAENGQIILSGTNLEIAIQSSFKAKVDNEGAFTIPAKILTSYISLLKDEDLKVQLESTGDLSIQQGISDTKIKGIPAEEFPIIPKIEKENEIELPANELKNLISKVVFAASVNPSRPVLTGVLFEIDGDEVKLAATDSYRLSEVKFTAKLKLENSIKTVVPSKTMFELSKIISGEKNVKVLFAKNQIVFEWENVKFISRLIEGIFPDYKAILPASSNVKVEVSLSELILALKKLSIFAVEKSGSIHMSATNDGILHLFTEKMASGESSEKISAKVDGKNTKVLININYLMDILNNIDTEKTQIEMGEKLIPVLIKPLNKNNYTNIIMP